MTYTAPVSQAAIDRAESRFMWFVAGSMLGAGGVIVSWWLTPDFWSGHRIWVSGALLITLSVLHAKYFDILGGTNPGNRLYDPSNGGRVSTHCRVVEAFVKFAWLVGFILMGLSRWQANS